MPLRRISVLGGSDPAAGAEAVEAARATGRVLAESGISLFWDKGLEGPRGALAAAFGSAGGSAVAANSSEAAEHADGFLVLPGGGATLAELFAAALDGAGAGEKPCGLLNTAGYFSDLLKTAGDAVLERFARESQRGRLIVERDPAELLRAMREYRPPETRRQSA